MQHTPELQPVSSSQANTTEQAQTAFDFGDSQKGVPVVLSEPVTPDWVLDPRTAVRRWMSETRKSSGKSYNDRSVTQYVAMVGAVCDHWRASGRDIDILTATVADLEAFLVRPNARGQASSDGTRRRYLGLLQSVFDHLVEAGLRNTNPARELLQLPANSIVERPDPFFLLPDQLEQLQAALLSGAELDWLSVRNRALIGTFAATGITTAEAQSLSVDNVAIQRAEITLYLDHRSADKRRSVPLAAWCTELMLDWLTARREIAPKLNLGATGGPLFPASLTGLTDQSVRSRPAKSLSDTEIYVIVAEALASISEAGAKLGPQTLRNTFAVSRLISGAKDPALMSALGLQTPFTLDVLRKLLLEKGLISPKKRS